MGAPAALLQAAPFTFDADGALPLNDGSGVWTAIDTNWSPDGLSLGLWGNGATDIATFGVNSGAAGTVTVDTVNANGITFSAPGSGNYTLSGGTITLLGTTPTITANVDATISSALAGTAGFTKAGAGTLTLSGTNTLTGTVNVNSGTLKLAAGNVLPSNTAFTVTGTGAGVTATLDLGSANQTTGAISMGGSTATSASQIIGSGTLTITGDITYVMTNNPLGAKILVPTLDLNGATRLITVNASTNASPDMTISSVIQNGAVTKQNSGGLALSGLNTFSGGITINNGNVQITVIGIKGQPGNLGNNDTIILGNTTSNTGQITYNGVGETTDRIIRLQGTTGGGNITNNNSGGAATPLKFTSDLNVSGAGSKTFTLQGTGTGEFAGLISNNSATNLTTVTKAQGGSWTLSATNTFSGGMNINQGIVNVTVIGNKGQNGNLGNVNTINLGSGTTNGQIVYNGVGETTDRTLNLNGTTGGGTLTSNATTTPLKFTSDLTATGVGNKTLTLQGTGSAEFAGLLVNPAANVTSVTKAGTGTWILSNTNTYSGATTVNAGTLQISNNAAIGSGTLTLNDTSFFEPIVADRTISNPVVIGGATATIQGSRNLTLTGSLTNSGGSRTLAGSMASGFTLNINGPVYMSELATTGRTLIMGGSGNTVINGVIADFNGAGLAGTLRKNGAGTLILNANNTYTGDTNDRNGILVIGGNVGVSVPSPVGAAATPIVIGLETGAANANTPTLLTGGAFTVSRSIVASDLSTGTETLGGSHTSGTSIYAGNVTLGLTATVGKDLSLTAATGGTVVFSGNIVANGTSTANITKIGGGTVVYSGADTYTGTTTVSAGSLLVNGTHLNAGAYIVSGGTLGGGGTITTNNANVTVSGTGRLSPGNSPGLLTLSLGTGVLDVSAAGPGSLVFDLGDAVPANSDRVVLSSGTLNIGTLDFAAFSFVPQPGFAPGDFTLFQGTSPIIGTLGNATGTVNGLGATLKVVGNDLVLSVPEPSAVGLVALAGTGLLARRHRVRRECTLPEVGETRRV